MQKDKCILLQYFNSNGLEKTQMSIKGDWLNKQWYVLIMEHFIGEHSIWFYGIIFNILSRKKSKIKESVK